MAAKKVWLTWMPIEEGAPGPEAALGALQNAGLQTSGSKWVDDLEKVAWSDLGGALLDPKAADIWVVAARRADLAANRNRYALSLAAAMVRSDRPAPLPLFIAGLDFTPTPDDLPPLLKGAKCVSAEGAGWGAKVVAGALTKGAAAEESWRLNVIAHALIGQWFEVGPASGTWDGAVLGVSGGAEITQHAVGPKGELPERTVVEYPMRGIKAEMAGTEYTAWAVKNQVGPEASYYVKVDGHPDRIVFGPAPTGDDPEVIALALV